MKKDIFLKCFSFLIDSAEKQMQETLDSELKEALDKIKEHMKSKDVQERLSQWKDQDCPENDNIDRLHQLQVWAQWTLIISEARMALILGEVQVKILKGDINCR